MIQRKVCLVGDFAVGKTSLFNRFVTNRFSEAYLSTVGVRVQRKQIAVHGEPLALVLWDTEGGRDSRELRTSYTQGTAGAVVVCDLTRLATILHCEEYGAELRRAHPHLPIALAGNKSDLLPADHAHLAVARQVAKALGAPLTITSALNGEGIEALFQSLGEELLDARTIS